MADYDDPRPSSQPTGSTEGVVAEDNLITLDTVMTAPTGTKITNRKGKVLTPMVDIVGEAQAIVQNAIDQISSVVSVPDGNISLTQTGAELQTILDDSASVLKAVAISAGTTVENVMLATNKLDPVVGFIYDVDKEITYSVPSDAQGKFIASVVGRVLTTTDASVYTLTPRNFTYTDDGQFGTSPIFVRDTASKGKNPTTIQSQRIADSSIGTNPKNIRAVTTIVNGVDSVEFVVSAELENYSDDANDGSAAVSAITQKYGFANCFAGHLHVKDNQNLPSSSGGAMVCSEVDLQANGEDDAEIRIGLDIVGKTNPDNYETFADVGQFYCAIRVRGATRDPSGGKWINAMRIVDGIHPIINGITLETAPGSSVGYAFQDTGAKSRGIDLRGPYGIAAINMAGADLTNSNTLIKMKDKGTIEFADGVHFGWSSELATPSLQLSGQPLSTTATAGTASALPALPSGFVKMHVNGAAVKIPYYNE